MTRLNVLAVDDELGMRKGIERTLKNFTIEVPDTEETVAFDLCLAETGSEAVEAISSEVPDILLLDYKLPDFNGLEVLKKTADTASDMLTIMITAYASIETAVAATKQGAYDFLPKPFTPADLKHTVRKAATRIVLARRARQLEEEKKRVRFEFIRVLGHELKAPIAAVEGYMQLLDSHIKGEELSSYDTFVDRSLVRLQQMRKLIVDLLDMTRIESGEKTRELEPIDLVAAAHDAVELLENDATERGISLTVHAPAELVINADRSEVNMMMNNLVSNAVKYNRDDGQVDVFLESEEGYAVIKVTDTGIGMTEKEVEKLFGEFVRIRNKKTRNILGSGLGLSILKRLSQLYEGDIHVESEPDRGSTFQVRLKPNSDGSKPAGKEDSAIEAGE